MSVLPVIVDRADATESLRPAPGSALPPPASAEQDGSFCTNNLRKDLKTRAVRGAAAIGASQAALLLLQIVAVPILARLLTPADFGLVAMVTAITGFVSLFEDAGLSAATVQRSEITHAQVSTLFWVNTAIGVLMMVSTACLAPGIAWFYHEPRLVAITLVLASIMFLGPLNVQHRAILERQMRFATLSTISVLTRVTTITTGIVIAFLGGGYWALVAMPVAGATMTAGLIWGASGWRPGLPVRGCGVRSMLAFGGNLTGSKLLTYARRNVDNILIGWVWGAASLGIYSKAYSLLMLPTQLVFGPISSVAVPTLSRLQNDPERLRSYFRKGCELIAIMAAPLAAFTFVAVEDIVVIILGRQWMECAPIFRVLAPAAFFMSITAGGTWLFVALGRTREQLRAEVVQTATIVAGLCAGLRWNVYGVAVGFTAAAIPSRLLYMLQAMRNSPIGVSDVVLATWRPAVSSLVAAVFIAASRALSLGGMESSARLGVTILLFMVAYGSTLWGIPGGKAIILESVRLVRPLRA